MTQTPFDFVGGDILDYLGGMPVGNALSQRGGLRVMQRSL
jgi:hypothetical protein